MVLPCCFLVGFAVWVLTLVVASVSLVLPFVSCICFGCAAVSLVLPCCGCRLGVDPCCCIRVVGAAVSLVHPCRWCCSFGCAVLRLGFRLCLAFRVCFPCWSSLRPSFFSPPVCVCRSFFPFPFLLSRWVCWCDLFLWSFPFLLCFPFPLSRLVAEGLGDRCPLFCGKAGPNSLVDSLVRFSSVCCSGLVVSVRGWCSRFPW